MKNFENIYFRDDPFFEWEFTMKFEINSREAKEELVKNISLFQKEYIAISQKYQIGEIIPLPFIKSKGINIFTVYNKYFRDYVYLNDKIVFFPLMNMVESVLSDEFISLHPGSTKYKILLNNRLEFDYFNICDNILRRLKESNYNKLYPSDDNFSISNISELISDNYYEIGFLISSYSEFWLEKNIYGSGNSWENGTINELAYYNTPRLNSFLRDLKCIWKEKFGWDFKLSTKWMSVTEEGILLDGKIIYQEDVDAGRFIVPSSA